MLENLDELVVKAANESGGLRHAGRAAFHKRAMPANLPAESRPPRAIILRSQLWPFRACRPSLEIISRVATWICGLTFSTAKKFLCCRAV